MTAQVPADRTPSNPDTSDGDRQFGLLDSLKAISRDVQVVVQEQLRLAALETKQAGQSFVMMVALGVIAAVLIVTSWLAIVIGIAVGMSGVGIAWPLSLALVVTVNLCLAIGLIFAIRRHAQRLLFSATVESLRKVPAAPNRG